MDPAILAYSRQKSLYGRLETVANNVANVNTSGFKADLAVYTKSTNQIDGKMNPSPQMTMTGPGIKISGACGFQNHMDFKRLTFHFKHPNCTFVHCQTKTSRKNLFLFQELISIPVKYP